MYIVLVCACFAKCQLQCLNRPSHASSVKSFNAPTFISKLLVAFGPRVQSGCDCTNLHTLRPLSTLPMHSLIVPTEYPMRLKLGWCAAMQSSPTASRAPSEARPNSLPTVWENGGQGRQTLFPKSVHATEKNKESTRKRNTFLRKRFYLGVSIFSSVSHVYCYGKRHFVVKEIVVLPQSST